MFSIFLLFPFPLPCTSPFPRSGCSCGIQPARRGSSFPAPSVTLLWLSLSLTSQVGMEPRVCRDLAFNTSLLWKWCGGTQKELNSPSATWGVGRDWEFLCLCWLLVAFGKLYCFSGLVFFYFFIFKIIFLFYFWVRREVIQVTASVAKAKECCQSR